MNTTIANGKSKSPIVFSKQVGMRITASLLFGGIPIAFPEAVDASVTAALSSREKNDLGIQGEMTESEAFIGRQDCMDDVEFTVTINISSENTDGRELYIFSGDNCNSSDDSEDCDEDVRKLDAGTKSVKLPVSFIIDTDDCKGDDAPSLWIGLLKSRTEKKDNADWASPIDFDFDGSSPAAPKEISASGGEENLYVKWKADDDGNDPASFLIVYAKAEETDEESIIEEDADGGIDGGVSDTASETDASQEAGCMGPLMEGDALTSSMKWTKISSGSSKSGRVKKLKNGDLYQVAVVAIDEYGNPSPLSEVVCKRPANTLNFYEVYRAAGGKGGDFCFIATAAYGNIDHPVVRILRRFRDEVLLKLPFGAEFVSWYYRIGPKLVSTIHSETAYDIIRAGLLSLAGAALLVMDKPLEQRPIHGALGFTKGPDEVLPPS